MKKNVLMLASVASMIDQFNLPNIQLMQKAGYQVHVACNFEKGNTCDRQKIQELKDALYKQGVLLHQWDCPRNIRLAEQCVRAYRQLWKLTGQYFFDWMHCHSPIGGALARVVAHQRKIAVIYTAHGFHFYIGAPFVNWLLYYPVEKLLSYWTDVLVTVNREDYQFARRSLNAGKICYIPGIGIDIGKFQKQEGREAQKTERMRFCNEYKIPEDAILLLSVGELSKRKNHQAMVAALAQINRTDIYYLICGQGELQETLMRQAQTLGVADRVIMLGFQQNVALLYHNADIFVFPSLQEGMPVALMEAMAAGMPCVVSDIRGNRDLIDGMGGKKFSVSDIGQLRDGILYFLEKPEQRALCGQHNQRAITGYSIEAVQKRMWSIYAYIRKGNILYTNVFFPNSISFFMILQL